MSKSTAEILAGLGFILLALAFFVQLEATEGISRIFPIALITFISLGGLYCILKGLYLRAKSKDSLNLKTVNWRRVGKIAALSLIYGLLIPILGFFAATWLFLFFGFILLHTGVERPKIIMLRAFCFAAILSSAIWVGFVWLLNVATPQGVLF